MSINIELNELLNSNFNKYKEERKKKLLQEQQDILNNYNKEVLPYNNLDNFYTNYFNKINEIISDVLSNKKWIKDDRLFYLGVTLIFISLIYLLIYNIFYK